MYRLWFRCLVICFFWMASPGCGRVWDELCSEGSQCATMLNNYANLVKGDGCTSFYTTGKCSRICTFSLKSLINRNSWSKCSQRCDWSSAIVDGAKSWLAMCLANPASDVFESEENSKTTVNHSLRNEPSTKLSDNLGGSLSLKTKGPRSSIIPYVMILAIATGLALSFHPKLKQKAHNSFVLLSGRLRRLKEKYQNRTATGRGPLDLGTDMKELRTLHRGARRHLKSLRSVLD